MGRKHVLHQYNMLKDRTVNMSATFTSNQVNVEQLDKGSIHLSWTAGPTGTFTVEARNGGNPAANTALPQAPINDSWYELDLGSAITIAGSDSQIQIVFNEMPFTDIRVVWTAATGAATDLKILFSAKAVGA
jgi:hypothetical protein